MSCNLSANIPTILFGAFDRHNFGDLLFPHIVAALLTGKECIPAGLAARDLRPVGGHLVQSLQQAADTVGGRAVNIIHVGGELLTCNALQAAIMLMPQVEAYRKAAAFERDQHAGIHWAQRELGIAGRAPYLATAAQFNHSTRIIYNAVGGVEFDEIDPTIQEEVSARLHAANAIGVRDLITLALLEKRGIACVLLPDPAVLVKELFGARIELHTKQLEFDQYRSTFGDGYLAVQFSIDFDDDLLLASIAEQLDRVVAATGMGIVLFRAGAAPWHDDIACYYRVVDRMQSGTARIFTSLNIWDICALIANSRAYCGGSLHGRILAMAYALPRVSLLHPTQSRKPTKQAAFAATWDKVPGMPVTILPHFIEEGVRAALATEEQARRCLAEELAACYRQQFSLLEQHLL